MKIGEKRLRKLCKEYHMSTVATEKVVKEFNDKYAGLNFAPFKMGPYAGGGYGWHFDTKEISIRFLPYITGHPMHCPENCPECVEFDDGKRVHVFEKNGNERAFKSSKAIMKEAALEQKEVSPKTPVKKGFLQRILGRSR